MRTISIALEKCQVNAKPRRIQNFRITRCHGTRKFVYRKPWTIDGRKRLRIVQ